MPVCLSAGDLHLRTGEGLLDLLSPSRPRMLLALPQPQLRASAGYDSVGVRSLCHPRLRERTLRRLGGGLQALVERWDHSSLEELEAFIDLYFEMLWEQSTGSPEISELEEQSDVETGDGEVISSINRRLSKLELLEEIQKELKELRTDLEQRWKLTELMEHKHDKNNT